MTQRLRWTSYAATSFVEFRVQWDALNDQVEGSPLLSSSFVDSCLQHFGSGHERLLLCFSDSKLVAGTVLGSTRAFRCDLFRPSQAPLGFWLSVPSIPLSQILESFMLQQRAFCLVSSITQLDPSMHPPPPIRHDTNLQHYIQTARLNISQDWNEYWASRSKNFRQNHRKARNRLQRAGSTIEYFSLTKPADLREAVGLYGQVESASWKEAEGTAVSPTNGQGKFYSDLLGHLAEQEQARAFLARIDGVPAAIDLCLTSGHTLIVLKTTFSSQFKDFSPASLLREYYFREIFEAGKIRRIEFYGRTMEWHLKWTEDVREIYHLTLYRYGWLRRLRSILVRNDSERTG